MFIDVGSNHFLVSFKSASEVRGMWEILQAKM